MAIWSWGSSPAGTLRGHGFGRPPQDRSTGVIASALEIGLAIAAGVGLGFLLGVAIMSLWLRYSDPRVADIRHVYGTTGIPATRFDDITRGRASALIDRWLALSSKPSTRVALIPSGPKLAKLANEAAEWLAAMDPVPRRVPGGAGNGAHGGEPTRGQPPPTVESTPPPSPAPWRRRQRPQRHPAGQEVQDTSELEAVPAGDGEPSMQIPPVADLVVVATGSSDSEFTPEGEAQRSDVIVLLVQADSRGKDLLEVVLTLEQFGHRPEWILLVDSIRKTRQAIRREGGKGW
jgi:hypothetical protein